MKLLNRQLLGAAILAGAAALPGLVYASTAANTTITNTVTVNFANAANVAQTPVEASVDLTVNLVASAPTLSSPADVDPTTENTAVNLVYTITSTANGPDTYNFGSVDTGPSNMNGAATFNSPSITLGATTLAADAVAGAGFIVVPYDSDAGNNTEVNGLTAGDTILIGTEVYTVDVIDKAATLNNNTVQIPLTTNIVGATVTTGSIVGEQTTVTVIVTTDFITAGTSGTHTIETTATSTTDAGAATTQAVPTVITVRRPVLEVTKFVRNATPATTFNPGAADITVDGVDYYAAGVSGNPGDTMQYLIVIDNSAAGAGVANNIVVSDPVPQFTSFVPASISLDDGTGTFAAQAEAIDSGSAAEFDATGNGTVYVYAGAGGSDLTAGAGNGTGGTLQPGEISYVIFQVEID